MLASKKSNITLCFIYIDFQVIAFQWHREEEIIPFKTHTYFFFWGGGESWFLKTLPMIQPELQKLDQMKTWNNASERSVGFSKTWRKIPQLVKQLPRTPLLASPSYMGATQNQYNEGRLYRLLRLIVRFVAQLGIRNSQWRSSSSVNTLQKLHSELWEDIKSKCRSMLQMNCSHSDESDVLLYLIQLWPFQDKPYVVKGRGRSSVTEHIICMKD